MAEGYDADITLIDMKAQRTIRHEDMYSKCGWTPFDGLEVTGWPMATIIRGHVVMREGELLVPSLGEACRFVETL
jgi:dihydroorotase